jgi:hypothetical protein
LLEMAKFRWKQKMDRVTRQIFVLAIFALPAIALAGHSDLMVPPSDTFLLGSDQGGAMTVTGTNVGKTGVIILARTAAVETKIADVPPGTTFKHSYGVGETALIRNGSSTATARVSVDFTGSPASLSMRYTLPQKK